MQYDDLNAPLGQSQVPERPPRNKALSVLAVFGAAGFLAALTASLLETVTLPLTASHDQSVSPLPPAESLEAVSIAARSALPPLPAPGAGRAAQAPRQEASTASAPAGQAGEGLEAIEKRTGVKVVRAGGGIVPEPLVIDVAKALDAAAVAGADPRIIERSRYGPIPRIGADGARPSEVYSRAAPSPDEGGRTPRIALLVGGMGLVPRATETAISKLPAGVTLGFAPHGAGLARQAAIAREAGHEIVLQIPMEPFDFPGDNPGPRTLLASAEKAANLDNLTWLMSRFTGYAGVMNFLGGRLTADAKALTPVLSEVAARGLFYLDGGTSSQSLAMALAPGLGLAASRADVIVDSTAQPVAVEAALARLETIAREKGVAIGVASALPASILAVGRFARELEPRGITLIPLSAAIENRQGGLADSSPVR
ncbi:MAG: divergent polysaccharide deacetylase family protein [Beijerinckiaceae bacterium]|nr:divergent polysaccharide deacetylase family protein [Beijerinckiaceae bacterium]MCI0736119.1 divergent polysaccharide deacetylase family protein [Beijerinckiaceae bacterium]